MKQKKKKECETEVKESFHINATQYWCQLFRTFEELPFGNQADKFGLLTRHVVDIFAIVSCLTYVADLHCFVHSQRAFYLFFFRIFFFQVKLLWGDNFTADKLHDVWEHNNIPWLSLDNKPLPKKFRGEIHEDHMRELLKTEWTKEKVNDWKLSLLDSLFQQEFSTFRFSNIWEKFINVSRESALEYKLSTNGMK